MDTISGLQITSMFCTGALLSSNEKQSNLFGILSSGKQSGAFG